MTPKTTWVQPPLPKGEYKYVPKPDKPKQGKGSTKYDQNFDYMLLNDLAIIIPTDEIPAIKKAFQRYEVNKEIKGEYSFRQAHVPNTRTHTIWLDKQDAQEE